MLNYLFKLINMNRQDEQDVELCLDNAHVKLKMIYCMLWHESCSVSE